MPATTISAPLAPAQDAAVSAPVRDFLGWVARGPRTYEDVMEAWRSTCPRFTVWEDALHAGLVQVERCPGLRFGEERVTLTPLGRTALDGA